MKMQSLCFSPLLMEESNKRVRWGVRTKYLHYCQIKYSLSGKCANDEQMKRIWLRNLFSHLDIEREMCGK